MPRDIEKRRAYQREYQRKLAKKRREERSRSAEFDNYSYKIVPNTWRNLAPEAHSRYATPEITSPLVQDILRGKTVLVDYTMPFGKAALHPFRALYSYCNTRGYRLRVHVIDVVDKEEYRKILMWAVPIKPEKYPRKEESAA